LTHADLEALCQTAIALEKAWRGNEPNRVLAALVQRNAELARKALDQPVEMRSLGPEWRRP
jgi:hypothetical protein